MAGKNKLSRGVTISIDDSGGTPRDLSGDLVPGSLSGLGFTSPALDMTGESDTVQNFLGDRKVNTITCRFHANDTVTTGASTVLNGIVGSVVTVLVKIGQAGVAPTTGDQKFSGEFLCVAAPMVNDGGRLVHDCTFQPSGSVAQAWGTV